MCITRSGSLARYGELLLPTVWVERHPYGVVGMLTHCLYYLTASSSIPFALLLSTEWSSRSFGTSTHLQWLRSCPMARSKITFFVNQITQATYFASFPSFLSSCLLLIWMKWTQVVSIWTHIKQIFLHNPCSCKCCRLLQMNNLKLSLINTIEKLQKLYFISPVRQNTMAETVRNVLASQVTSLCCKRPPTQPPPAGDHPQAEVLYTAQCHRWL